ncbi:MAG TPA: FCD domain-containing protein, partial [Actinomycetales bacterium]|nr:FCD domain-containing protein [Actinomycetales bacterium]
MPRDSAAPRPGAGPSARRGSLIEHVTHVLREQVTSGAWPVGSRIPTEPELVELTGTGRNTVREGVQSLVHAGLLERRQGSGTYVMAVNELGVAVGRRMASARHRDVLEVRRTLEVGAARLAATRRTPQDVERLERLLASRNAARLADDLDATADADIALHRAIAQAGGNPVLAELYDHLLEAVGETVRFNFAHVPPGGDDDHALLVGAVVAGDADAAAREAAGFL